MTIYKVKISTACAEMNMIHVIIIIESWPRALDWRRKSAQLSADWSGNSVIICLNKRQSKYYVLPAAVVDVSFRPIICKHCLLAAPCRAAPRRVARRGAARHRAANNNRCHYPCGIRECSSVNTTCHPRMPPSINCGHHVKIRWKLSAWIHSWLFVGRFFPVLCQFPGNHHGKSHQQMLSLVVTCGLTHM